MVDPVDGGVAAVGIFGAAAFACDVTKRDQVQAMVDDVVKRFGRLDILINDAAYNKAIAFTDLDGLTYDEWTKIIDINLTGPMLLTKAVAPQMKKQGAGRIVNISSVAGLGPSGSSIAYAVSKAGLIHLTKCMAVALAPEVLSRTGVTTHCQMTAERLEARMPPTYMGPTARVTIGREMREGGTNTWETRRGR